MAKVLLTHGMFKKSVRRRWNDWQSYWSVVPIVSERAVVCWIS
jgi:hypothetical protein